MREVEQGVRILKCDRAIMVRDRFGLHRALVLVYERREKRNSWADVAVNELLLFFFVNFRNCRNLKKSYKGKTHRTQILGLEQSSAPICPCYRC